MFNLFEFEFTYTTMIIILIMKKLFKIFKHDLFA